MLTIVMGPRLRLHDNAIIIRYAVAGAIFAIRWRRSA
jgi:hypothetical protein